jgi:hypothetical protein
MIEHDTKSAYNNIPIPENLSSVVDKNIEKAFRARKYVFIKPLTIVAASILLFVLTVNTIPAFASLVHKVPVLSNIVEFVQFDKGLQSAAAKGYIQEINKSIEDQDIKFTIKEIIFDKKRLIVYYRIDSDLNIKSINLDKIKLKYENGNQLECFADINITNDTDFMNIKYKEDIIDFNMPDDKDFPENIIIDLKGFKVIGENDTSTIEGNWSLPIKLDSNMLNMEPRVLKYNKTAQIGPMEFNIKNISIYPCSVHVNIEMDKNNPYKFCGFINPRLVDKNGSEYTSRRSTINSDLNRVLYFESNYFIDSKSLKLEFDGIFYIPKENQIIQFDLKNHKILRDPGYGLEFLYTREDNFTEKRNEGKPSYVVAFKIKDKEIIENMKFPRSLFGGIDFGKMYDNNGKVYESNGSGTVGPRSEKDAYIERFIYINNFSPLPDILNVEVTACVKGTVDKLSLKLK